MKWKLTFGVFAVIILTVEAAISKYHYFDESVRLEMTYGRQQIRRMATEIRDGIPEENILIVGGLPVSLTDQWKLALERVYTGYRVTISKKGGATVIETVPLDPLPFNNEVGMKFLVYGTVFRTSNQFPNLTIDVERQIITDKIRLRGNPIYGGPDFFVPVQQLIERATPLWPMELFEGYEVSEVTRTDFLHNRVRTIAVRLNPNERPVVTEYNLDELTDLQWEKTLRAEASLIYELRITEQGGSTVIDRFYLRSLDFVKPIVYIDGISFEEVSLLDTEVDLVLGFPNLKISAHCHSTTERNENIQGNYDGPDITVTFEKLVVFVKSRWYDDGQEFSQITGAEIVYLSVEGNMEIKVSFDPKMQFVIKDMLESFDGLVQKLFNQIETNVKQSAEATVYLKEFLERLFYDNDREENFEPGEGNGDADSNSSQDSGFGDD